MTPPLLLVVAAGGALGSLARYGAGAAMTSSPGGLPVATLLVNVVGCLALGLLLARWGDDPLRRGFLGTGVLGGFTTFSAFALETDRLIVDRPAMALVYAGLSVGGGLAALALGRRALR